MVQSISLNSSKGQILWEEFLGPGVTNKGLGALCVVFACMYPGACTRVRLELSAGSRSA